MDNKILYQYEYGQSKNNIIVLSISILIISTFLFLEFLESLKYEELIIPIFLLIISMHRFSLIFKTKYIRIFENGIEIPNLYFNISSYNLYTEITHFYETYTEIFSNIHIHTKKNRFFINSNLMKYDEYNELLGFLRNRREFTESEIPTSNLKLLYYIISIMLIGTIILDYFSNEKLDFLDHWTPIIVSVLIIYFGIINVKKKEIKNTQDIQKLKIKHTFEEIKTAFWQIKTKAILLTFGSIFSILFLMYFLEKERVYTEYESYIILSLSISIIAIPLIKKYYLKKLSILAEKYTNQYTFFITMFNTAILITFFVFINITFGNVKKIKRYGSLAQNEVRNSCFGIIYNGNEFGVHEYCQDKYPRLSQEDEVTFDLYDGFLGFSYLKNISFSRYETPDTYISYLKKEDDLRYFDIKMLYDLKGEKFWEEKIYQWEASCEQNHASKCRLASYVYYSIAEHQKVSALFTKGCELGEFLSCYNSSLDKSLSNENKEHIRNKLINECKGFKRDNENIEICDYLKNN